MTEASIVGACARAVVWILAVAGAVGPAAASGQQSDVKQVVVEGKAAIGSNIAAARSVAIKEALRRAVEQETGVLLLSETQVTNLALEQDRILAQSAGYVTRYQVVGESRQDDVLTVTVEASVDRARLSKDLVAIGLLQDRLGLPRLRISPADTTAAGRAAVERVSAGAVTKGFRVTEGDADVTVQVTSATSVTRLESRFESATADVIVTVTDDRSVVVGEGQGHARGADTNATGAEMKAARSAADLAWKDASDALLESWRARAYDVQEIDLLLDGVSSHDGVLSFLAQMQELVLSSERLLLASMDLAQHQAHLRWIGRRSTEELAETIQRWHFGAYVGTVEAMTATSLTVRFVPRKAKS